MEHADVNFVIWWYGVGAILAVATWRSLQRRALAGYEEVLKVLLVGVAAALALYMAPSGIASIQSPADFKLRFFAALGIVWLVTIHIASRRRDEIDGSGLALAGFIGVNAPPLALVLSTTMVCGGETACL